MVYSGRLRFTKDPMNAIVMAIGEYRQNGYRQISFYHDYERCHNAKMVSNRGKVVRLRVGHYFVFEESC